MDSPDFLIAARWIVPVVPEGAVLEDHALAVRDGRITAIVAQATARAQWPGCQIHERPGHCLIPGLVNAHTHAAMTLFRGLADDLPLKDWLEGHVWPAEQRWASPAFVRDGTRLAAAEMLRGGTTCFSDMYFYPDEAGRAAAEAGMRAVVGLICFGMPTVWAGDSDEYLRKGVEVHDHFRAHPLVRTAFAPHAPYTVDDAALGRLAVLAEELDVPVHIHLHETEREVAEGLAAHGMRPLARLERLGLVSPRLVAVHATALEGDEIALLAERGAHLVHCPESNLKLASGFCPLERVRRAGVGIALGTDGAASNNDLDLLGEMRTASLLAKGVSGDPRALPAPAALTAATLGGARALGLESQIGSLEPGKAADLVAVELEALGTTPVYNPISQLVYAAGRHQVSDVWVAGAALVRGGALLSLEEPALLASAAGWRDRIVHGES